MLLHLHAYEQTDKKSIEGRSRAGLDQQQHLVISLGNQSTGQSSTMLIEEEEEGSVERCSSS
jgi:hypothetical protein